MLNDIKNLDVWKKAHSFRQKIFQLCKNFPNEEKYELVKQLIRSSRSISANIAEGHGRFHFKENIQFCRMARGSLYESLDHLICARDCDYITEKDFRELEIKIDQIGKMLNGYIAYLQRRLKSTN